MHESPSIGRARRRRTTIAAAVAVLVATTGALSAAAPANAAAARPGCVDLSSAGSPATGGACGDAVALEPPAQTAAPASSASSAVLSTLSVTRSGSSVYPVPDSYRDTVRFAIHALDADGHHVPVQGTADLRKGGTTAESWALDGSTKVLRWDGRVGGRIVTGVYTLRVTAWSADGTKRVEETKVRVLSKHVERHAVTVRSNVGSTSLHAAMPKRVLKAFAKGPVTVRVRTDARVTGPARLVFANTGVSRAVALRDGVHTTRAYPIFKDFERVTIRHDWRRGDAHLTSVKAIWTYWTLV